MIFYFSIGTMRFFSCYSKSVSVTILGAECFYTKKTDPQKVRSFKFWNLPITFLRIYYNNYLFFTHVRVSGIFAWLVENLLGLKQICLFIKEDTKEKESSLILVILFLIKSYFEIKNMPYSWRIEWVITVQKRI